MGIEFEEQTSYQRQPTHLKKASGIIGFLIAKKIAKNPTQANFILIGVIIVLIFVMIISTSLGGGGREILLDASIDPETSLPYGSKSPQ